MQLPALTFQTYSPRQAGLGFEFINGSGAVIVLLINGEYIIHPWITNVIMNLTDENLLIWGICNRQPKAGRHPELLGK